MTARISMLYVILEKDVRIDEIDKLADAIAQFNNVLEVKTHIKEATEDIAQDRAKHELSQKLLEVLYPIKEKI